jgi:hypothetical protein
MLGQCLKIRQFLSFQFIKLPCFHSTFYKLSTSESIVNDTTKQITNIHKIPWLGGGGGARPRGRGRVGG